VKIEYMSQEKAEAIVPSDNMAIISIAGLDTTRELHAGWTVRMDIDFNDFLRPLPEDAKFDIYREYIFNEKKAKSIHDFIKSLPEKIDHIVIHCHHGVSRSATIAMILSEHYGEDFPQDYKYTNKMVYEILHKEFFGI
jgi:predicted protein tyrosine phosphatase